MHHFYAQMINCKIKPQFFPKFIMKVNAVPIFKILTDVFEELNKCTLKIHKEGKKIQKERSVF